MRSPPARFRVVEIRVTDVEADSAKAAIGLVESEPGRHVTGVSRYALALDVAEKPVPSPEPRRILVAVAKYLQLTVPTLVGPGRIPPAPKARSIAAYLLRMRCGLSLPEIGRVLRKHHATVLYASRRAVRYPRELREIEALLDG